MGPDCPTCGTPSAADGWCPRCLTCAPTSARPAFRPALPPTLDVTVGHRMGPSPLTFGPFGRMVWTASLLGLPLPLLWFGGWLFGWGFAGLWYVLIVPRALRDIWRTGRHTVHVRG